MALPFGLIKQQQNGSLNTFCVLGPSSPSLKPLLCSSALSLCSDPRPREALLLLGAHHPHLSALGARTPSEHQAEPRGFLPLPPTHTLPICSHAHVWLALFLSDLPSLQHRAEASLGFPEGGICTVCSTWRGPAGDQWPSVNTVNQDIDARRATVQGGHFQPLKTTMRDSWRL